jgi:hypothetical protein
MSFGLGPQYRSVDREAIWVALLSAVRSKLTAPTWSAGATIASGDLRVDLRGHLQKATNSGTTGATTPNWNDTGGTTSDNGITWQDTGAGFVSIGRKHIKPPNLSAAQQPALFIVQVMEGHDPKPMGAPTKLTLDGFLIIYLQGPAAQEEIGQEQWLAATDLNAIYKALDDVFQPDDMTTGKYTIGGLVTHCWFEGETRQDPGILGNQASAILPLHILVP